MLITKEQIEKGEHKLYLKMLLNGGFGVGKTYTSMTFPKWAYAQLEPHGMMTAYSNPHLFNQMVYFDNFVPSESEDIKETFNRLTVFLKKVREDAQKGLVETLILDNASFLSENRWIYINKYEISYGQKGGIDTRGMYGTLGRWLYSFMVLNIVSIPCHVIVTVHEMEEEEERDGKQIKTGRIISNILGGFRDKAAGLFNASLFLETKKLADGKYSFTARCKPGAGKPAKNNVGLPEIVSDISYQSIMDSIQKNRLNKN